MIWHSAKLDDVLRSLKADPAVGLSSSEASHRLESYGPNRLSGPACKPFKELFLSQLKNVMVVILFIAAAISLFTALLFADDKRTAWIEPVMIVAIVIIGALLGAVQESRAYKALLSVRSLDTPSARVLRDGQITTVSADCLVPGDIILLETGDYIPADARLISSEIMYCDESSVTGESIPAEKLDVDDIDEIAAIDQRLNMVYSGCSVTYGRGTAVVTETGMNTEAGKIARLSERGALGTVSLKQKLTALSKSLSYLVIAVCVLIFIIGAVESFVEAVDFRQKLLDVFMTSVALAVAAIPEGMVSVAAVVTALGIQRMIKKHAVIKNNGTAEKLGCTSVICAAKAGMLTQNRMSVESIYDMQNIQTASAGFDDYGVSVLRFASMCCRLSDSSDDPIDKAISDSTMLILNTKRSDFDGLYPRMCEIPFDPNRRLMTTVNVIDGVPAAIVKGAPEVLIERCVGCEVAAVKKAVDEMASNALRVIAVAVKTLDGIPADPSAEELEHGLRLVGLLGIADPVRDDAVDAIRLCRGAGIRTIMMTGDYIVTAEAVARRLGILHGDLKAVTGAEVSAMSDKELSEKVGGIAVYAQLSAEDKLRIITALKKQGETVTMTGGGSSDAPALRAADIGCAFGTVGSDSAKSAADIVLTDDSFGTVANAIRESRGIIDNILKSVRYLLSCNFGELIAVFFGFLFWGASPLTAIQLLLVNLITDGAPALALGMEPAESDVMAHRRERVRGILTRKTVTDIIWQGVLIGFAAITAFLLGRNSGGVAFGNTMAFAVLSLSQIVHAFSTRTVRSVFLEGVGRNVFMLAAAGLSAFVVAALIVIRPLGVLFGTVPLPVGAWLGVILLSLVPLAVSELVKLTKHILTLNAQEK